MVAPQLLNLLGMGLRNITEPKKDDKVKEEKPKDEKPKEEKPKEEKKYARGGAVKSTASKRGDGCALKGKTKGRMV